MMAYMQAGLLYGAAILFAVGGLFMKYSAGMTRVAPSIAFLVCFCAGASAQALAMRRADMGSVYIFVLGLEAVVALCLSLVVLGERVTVFKGVAVVLILAGIALLDRAS